MTLKIHTVGNYSRFLRNLTFANKVTDFVTSNNLNGDIKTVTNNQDSSESLEQLKPNTLFVDCFKDFQNR